MKQIALGLLMYTQDNDERFIVLLTGGSTPKWPTHIQPYVKSWQIFRCPSYPRFVGGTTSDYYSSYGLCGDANAATESATSGFALYNLVGKHLASIAEPARTWMLVESKYNSSLYDTNGYGFLSVAFSSVALGGKPEARGEFNHDIHMEGSNVAYVDGHVKWRKSGSDSGIWDLFQKTRTFN